MLRNLLSRCVAENGRSLRLRSGQVFDFARDDIVFGAYECWEMLRMLKEVGNPEDVDGGVGRA